MNRSSLRKVTTLLSHEVDLVPPPNLVQEFLGTRVAELFDSSIGITALRKRQCRSRISFSSEGSYDLWLGVLASSVETSCRAGAGIATRRDRTICFAGIFRP